MNMGFFEKPDITNHYGVDSSDDGAVIRIMGLMPVIRAQTGTQSPLWPLALLRQEALLLAAWIVAVASPENGEFERILDYVRGKPVA